MGCAVEIRRSEGGGPSCNQLFRPCLSAGFCQEPGSGENSSLEACGLAIGLGETWHGAVASEMQAEEQTWACGLHTGDVSVQLLHVQQPGKGGAESGPGLGPQFPGTLSSHELPGLPHSWLALLGSGLDG